MVTFQTNANGALQPPDIASFRRAMRLSGYPTSLLRLRSRRLLFRQPVQRLAFSSNRPKSPDPYRTATDVEPIHPYGEAISKEKAPKREPPGALF